MCEKSDVQCSQTIFPDNFLKYDNVFAPAQSERRILGINCTKMYLSFAVYVCELSL